MVYHYSKVWGIFLAAVGVLNIVMAILILSRGFSVISGISELVCGGVILLLGILYLTGRYFTHDKNSKTVLFKALIGPVKREYSYDRIYVEGGRIFIEKDGKKQKLPFMKMMMGRQEWEKFIAEMK